MQQTVMLLSRVATHLRPILLRKRGRRRDVARGRAQQRQHGERREPRAATGGCRTSIISCHCSGVMYSRVAGGFPNSNSSSSGRLRCKKRPLIVPFSVNSPAAADGGANTKWPPQSGRRCPRRTGQRRQALAQQFAERLVARQSSPVGVSAGIPHSSAHRGQSGNISMRTSCRSAPTMTASVNNGASVSSALSRSAPADTRVPDASLSRRWHAPRIEAGLGPIPIDETHEVAGHPESIRIEAGRGGGRIPPVTRRHIRSSERRFELLLARTNFSSTPGIGTPTMPGPVARRLPKMAAGLVSVIPSRSRSASADRWFAPPVPRARSRSRAASPPPHTRCIAGRGRTSRARRDPRACRAAKYRIQRHIEIERRRYPPQELERRTDVFARRLAGIDIERAAILQRDVEDAVAARCVIPRQPVDHHRPLRGEETHHLALHLAGGAQHAVRVDDGLGIAGRSGREQEFAMVSGPTLPAAAATRSG